MLTAMGAPASAAKVNKENGWDIKIHIDGASGGFVVPFLYPDLRWDFRLKNVVSINASGHKCASPFPPAPAHAAPTQCCMPACTFSH